MTTDEDRHPRLDGSKAEVLDGEAHLFTGQLGRSRIEQRPQSAHRLLEAGNTRPRRPQGHADGVVFGLGITGSDSEDQPPAAQAVDRRRRSGQQGRVVELVVEHQRTHAQVGRALGRHHQRHEGVEQAEMVRCEELVVSERLDLPAQLPDAVGVGWPHRLYGESERSNHQTDASGGIPGTSVKR